MANVNQSVVFIFLISYISLSYGYPNGAPVSSCASLTPGHKTGGGEPIASQPDSSFPYNLESVAMKGNSHGSGESIAITLSSNFQGFLIEARQGDSPIGEFDISGDENIQTINCGDGQKNAITHTNPTVKKSISATWNAPANFDRQQGAVEFHLTVAENHDTFWANHVVNV